MKDDSTATFDLVVWGATGFTGRLVAEYLLRRYGCVKDLRWALAGRSRGKLEALRRELTAIDPAALELELLIADSRDLASLTRLAERTKVVCTTVGPYSLYGDPLVRACAETGTHYADITGELHWMRDTIDRFGPTARANGARIVHACGMDSIPSDLGCLMLQDYAREHYGRPCGTIRLVVERIKGGFSGGTVASMLATAERLSDPAVRRVLGNPYALNPAETPRGPDAPDPRSVGFDPDLGLHTAPFMMAAVNTRVVRRSAALMRDLYGPDFRYDEVQGFGRGARGWLRAWRSVGQGAAMIALFSPPAVRRLIVASGRLPQPGDGPSPEEREAGCFDFALVGQGRDADGCPFRLRGRVAGDRDPGYTETAKMLAEAGLCLARGEGGPAGVVTPAYGLGMPLVERLRAADMVLTVEDWLR